MLTQAQTPVTFQYTYDSAGRLTAAVDSTGLALQYIYDAAGNLLQIRRIPPGQPAVFSQSATAGKAGDQVTFTGVNLGECTVTVTFNGVQATVVSQTANSVTVIIPPGATTGPVTITTCAGSVTLDQNFIIGAVVVTPPLATLALGDTVQFTATVLPAGSDQSVTWSVDGEVGGDATIGTISATGLYTASASDAGTVDVRATSVLAPALYGDATVTILDPRAAGEWFSPGVSVLLLNGANAPSSSLVSVVSHPVSVVFAGSVLSLLNATVDVFSRPVSVDTAGAAAGRPSALVDVFSPGVSVVYQVTGVGGPGPVYIVSKPVSVLSSAPSAPAEPYEADVFSPGVSVLPLRAVTDKDEGVIFVVSPGVSVQAPAGTAHALPPKAGPGGTGTAITALSPSRLVPGASGTVTVAGAHLDAARAVGFLDDAGDLDTGLTVQSAAVAPDGRTMTLRLSVSPRAALGRRRLVVWAATK